MGHAEPASVTHDGLEIRYAASPKPSAEAVILLSHWPEHLRLRPDMAVILASEFSLVAVDLLGFG